MGELRLSKCKNSDTWTLHGLWPQWKEDCHGPAFDASKIASIQDDMNTFWLSCPQYGGNNPRFWSHEWKKHGTCSGMDELTYFQTGLAKRAEYVSKCEYGRSCSLC